MRNLSGLLIAAALAEVARGDYDEAFLRSRLAEIYWTHQHDARRACDIPLAIVATFPNTQHAANARYRLQEIQRQLARE